MKFTGTFNQKLFLYDCTITYDKDKQTYTAICTTAAADTTAQAISQLVSKVEELETSNTALAAQVDYISMMTDTEVA